MMYEGLVMSNLRFNPGDHIRVKFHRILSYDLYHHGIVVEVKKVKEEGKEVVKYKVIHFNNEDDELIKSDNLFGKMIIREEYISEKTFGKLDDIEVVEHNECIYSPSEVVQRAEEIYRFYKNKGKDRDFVEFIRRISDPNTRNSNSDKEKLNEIYSQYPMSKFILQAYHFREHNCEHLATFIKTGKGFSTQENTGGASIIKNTLNSISVGSAFASFLGVTSTVAALAPVAIPLFGIAVVSASISSMLTKTNLEQEETHFGPGLG
jgi:hypothetical protein